MTAEEQRLTKQWVETWQQTGPLLARMRRDELRRLDSYQVLQALVGPLDFSQEPYCPKPTSGLIEQQVWFRKLGHD